MRLFVFTLGVFAAIICIEKPAEAQNGAWCLYINGDGDGEPHCRYATFEQCLADRSGATPVDLVRTLRRNHIRQLGSEGAKNARNVR
jgi:hypothetical protein